MQTEGWSDIEGVPANGQSGHEASPSSDRNSPAEHGACFFGLEEGGGGRCDHRVSHAWYSMLYSINTRSVYFFAETYYSGTQHRTHPYHIIVL